MSCVLATSYLQYCLPPFLQVIDLINLSKVNKECSKYKKFIIPTLKKQINNELKKNNHILNLKPDAIISGGFLLYIITGRSNYTDIDIYIPRTKHDKIKGRRLSNYWNIPWIHNIYVCKGKSQFIVVKKSYDIRKCIKKSFDISVCKNLYDGHTLEIVDLKGVTLGEAEYYYNFNNMINSKETYSRNFYINIAKEAFKRIDKYESRGYRIINKHFCDNVKLIPDCFKNTTLFYLLVTCSLVNSIDFDIEHSLFKKKIENLNKCILQIEKYPVNFDVIEIYQETIKSIFNN